MTPREETLILHAMRRHAGPLADLAVLLLVADGAVPPRDEVRGALERSLVGLLDVRERAWRAAR